MEAEKAAARKKFEALSEQVSRIRHLKTLRDTSEAAQTPAETGDKRLADPTEDEESYNKHKKSKKNKERRSGKHHKSSTAPRAHSEVMQDLLKRSEKAESTSPTVG